jgi:uncharacterized protein YcbK (DUF882 family)
MITAIGLMFPAFPKVGLAVPVKEKHTLPKGEHTLRLFNTHTDEKLHVCYWKDGKYLDEELAAVNHFFRDFRTGDVTAIDRRLLDLLHTISKKAPKDASLHLISGFRSPETNQKLRSGSKSVARKSLHMTGQAADIRIPGMKTSVLRKIAIDIGEGGVGFYQKSDFVHVDTGRVRQW